MITDLAAAQRTKPNTHEMMIISYIDTGKLKSHRLWTACPAPGHSAVARRG